MGRIALLTLIMACPVFTVLFAYDLGLWTQLLVTLAVALVISTAIVSYGRR